MATEDALVCVTGATGYIAAFVVQMLLQKGYRVRGTVRSLGSEAKLAPLKAMEGAERLELVEADLLRPDNFEEVLSGCEVLMHTATPIAFESYGSEEEAFEKQINPAVEGTKELWKAAAAAGGKKIVLTSSVAAMRGRDPPPSTLDDTSRSDLDWLRQILLTKPNVPYLYAKTLQEEVAWELASEYGIKMVTIHPTLVVGPRITPRLNDSNRWLLDLVAGRGFVFAPSPEKTIPDAYNGLVDVREVAQSHVLAMEDEASAGCRFLLYSHSVHLQDIANHMRASAPELAAKYPEWPMDSSDQRGGQAGGEAQRKSQPVQFDVSKTRALGVDEIPWEDSIAEAARTVLEAL
uniref:NAD-dependent epimerase/dehydratase domain-containing protein n=1 Tax=Pinguiococcus pyrenoidosus TaxID=172671 RepID=A0A7R9U5T0_9STRA|mmetsp:Transcript_16060/g.61239  ORF Transcript_16060/g.61239 Transcript_16060/m.61239 type:complete len:349 (+) Transcript_16060:273-1319(+)